MTLLKQYLQQCKRAAQLCSKQPIDVTLVIWPNGTKYISIIGNSISRVVYDLWTEDGAIMRKLRTYQWGKRL